MRIAGVDPGTIETGVGILEDLGKGPVLIFARTIHAGRTKEIALRLEIIFNELRVVFQEWKPDVLALENVFYQKDFKAAVKVGEARAAAMLAATASGIPVMEYPPARVKQSICGNGRATKEQVQYMVRQVLRFKGPLSDDSADAVAVALCHFHSQKFIRLKEELTHV
ncbi:MAG: crossover junction endodeoxyribonuclease RuvC [Candidatus Omnitrophica bacterium]|nr:crossover junction endodeoxyribonuclease RuvC [Candidatus Omnitrophota bacterium]